MPSLKRPKSKKKNEPDCCVNDNAYPWGTTIDIDHEIADRFPELKGASAGQKFTVTGKCEVKSLTSNKLQDGTARTNITLQMTELEFKPADGFDASFDEASKPK